MREIVFDTETTGLDPIQGDRLVEIGCIELMNRFPTGKTFHCYFNPERDMPEPALKVHGLTIEFLKDKPLFAHKVEELVVFLGDAPLVAHNAMFDLGFLNAELERAGRVAVSRERMVDTLLIARRKHPGGSNRLDDLCVRYAINNSHRVKHGALLDAELLAEVYIELIGARQAQLVLSQAATPAPVSGNIIVVRERPLPLPERVSAEEREAHRQFVATLGESGDLARLRQFGVAGCDGERLRGSQALAIEIDEIDRFKQQRRKATVARCRCHDLARERKQKARAFDQYNGLHAFGRHVLNAEDAGEGQLEAEQQHTLRFRLAVQPKRDLDVGVAQGRGINVDLNIDGRRLRARRHRARRIRIFERQVLHVLREHSNLRHRHLGCGPPFVVDILASGPARAGIAAWLTQGRQANNGGAAAAIDGAKCRRLRYACPKPCHRSRPLGLVMPRLQGSERVISIKIGNDAGASNVGAAAVIV